jgi:hypothetical protein
LPKEWPYAAALRDNELRTTDCERCPRCRRYPAPGKRQVLIPQLGIVYHPECFDGEDGLS